MSGEEQLIQEHIICYWLNCKNKKKTHKTNLFGHVYPCSESASWEFAKWPSLNINRKIISTHPELKSLQTVNVSLQLSESFLTRNLIQAHAMNSILANPHWQTWTKVSQNDWMQEERGIGNVLFSYRSLAEQLRIMVKGQERWRLSLKSHKGAIMSRNAGTRTALDGDSMGNSQLPSVSEGLRIQGDSPWDASKHLSNTCFYTTL